MTTGGAGRPPGTAVLPPWADEVTRRLCAPGQPFEMHERDVRGVRMRTWRHAPRSLGPVLELTRRYGDAEFLVYGDTRWTYAEHYRLAATVARRLRQDLGVQPGDRVAIAMRNLPEWSAVFWGIVAAGAVAVPLNAWWTAPELAYALADSGAVAAFCDAERAGRIGGERPGLAALRTVVVVTEVAPGGATAPGAPSADGDIGFDAFAGTIADDAAAPPTSVHPDDDATILYTSGTTAGPKGVVGTHRNACTSLMNLWFLNTYHAQRREPRAADVAEARRSVLLTVPLFHTTGCHSVLLPLAFGGGKLVLMRAFDPEEALELIERERISIVTGVPTVVMRLLDSPDLTRRDLSSLRAVVFGGAPAPAGLAARVRAALSIGQPGNGYGLTETSSVTAQISGEDFVTHPASVGRPVPVADVAIVAPGGAVDGATPCVPGAVGELWVRGPHVFRGYWNRPEETAQALHEGWLQTGDVATIDAEGFITIVDRIKDVIIRGGENVYCAEVEDALYDHPDVVDCAVVGVPHADLGEEVAAAVVLRAGRPTTAAQLAAHLAGRLAAYKIPTRWSLADAPLARNAAGKVLKDEVRRQLAERPSP